VSGRCTSVRCEANEMGCVFCGWVLTIIQLSSGGCKVTKFPLLNRQLNDILYSGTKYIHYMKALLTLMLKIGVRVMLTLSKSHP
jgi:hypothetical protein